MKRRTPRGLDPEEQDLWNRVARTATPLAPARKAQAPVEATTSTPKRRTEQIKKIKAFEPGSRSLTAIPRNDLVPSIDRQVANQAVTMDAKAFKKLKRGQSKPEARLDLHGMTLDAAHSALAAFILSAHSSGKRLVLVITGKGRVSPGDGPTPTRVGVLRHQVPQWLKQAPLAPHVLQVTQSHQRHGGLGALYVYLRRR